MNDQNTHFQNELLRHIAPFIGKSDIELFDYFGIHPSRPGQYPKNAWRQIIARLLDVEGNPERRKQFTRQGITIKTMRVNDNRKLKEAMSFPAFEFKELVAEQWETSTLREMFLETTYLFVVFRQLSSESYQFCGVKFWKMPNQDLEGRVRQAWLKTVEILNQGVLLTYNSRTDQVANNLPGNSDNLIVHVRPHASRRSYSAESVYASQLPKEADWKNKPRNFSADWMTKQSFWLNKEYVLSQISDLL